MNSPIEWPKPLSNIIGASGDSAQWNPIVALLVPGQGFLELGSVLSLAATGKLKLTDSSSYAQAYGILLERIDTGSDAASTEEFAATVARQGSFKATDLVLAAGADISQCAHPLRKNGIYLEGVASAIAQANVTFDSSVVAGAETGSPTAAAS